ncbi:MAG TPA: hypothetical protein P5026_10750 [Kiritimatiellia bacterium]|nr:hypothetical protein [Kiritimatiellia bacterium]HRU71391.1 hypothetical protein [Kiritimatiellia bacterium]
MKRLMGYVLMDKAGEGGGGAGTTGGGTDGGATVDNKDGGGSILGGAGAEGDGTDGGAGGAGESGTGGSILGGGGNDGKEGAGDADGGAPEVKPEEVEAFVAKIKKIDLGGGDDGAAAPAWDDGAVKAVVPLFIKHKVSDAAANEIVAAYAKHVTAQYQAAQEADRAVLRSMHEECRKRFGNDLKRFAAEGRRGGEKVFGKALFARLASVEAFGSDPDIIEALAVIGRGLAPDKANIGGAAGEPTERSLADRMYRDAVGKKK